MGRSRQARPWPSRTCEHGIVTANLDGRGGVDLVASRGRLREISTFLGNGDGTFAPGGIYSTGGETGMIASGPGVGDFNGDGDEDRRRRNGCLRLRQAGDPPRQWGRLLRLSDVLDMGGEGSGKGEVGHFDAGDDLDIVVPTLRHRGRVRVPRQRGWVIPDPVSDRCGEQRPATLTSTTSMGTGSMTSPFRIRNDGNVALLYSNGDGSFQAPGSRTRGRVERARRGRRGH